MRDFNGIYVPSRYEELAAEFNAEVPDWEKRLAEHDARESGRFIWESDVEKTDYLSTPISDWTVFLAFEER